MEDGTMMNRFITLPGLDGEEVVVNTHTISSLQDVEGWTRINILDGDTVDTTASIDEITAIAETALATEYNLEDILDFRYRVGQELLAEAAGSDDHRLFNGAAAYIDDIDAVISDIEIRVGMCIGDYLKAGYRWNS